MKLVIGDLVESALAGEYGVIVHGCNCFCRMGRGIAKTIKEKIPEAYEADQQTISGDKNKLGTCTTGRHNTKDGHLLLVCNAYTQYHWKEPKNEVLADYNAIRSCMRFIALQYPEHKIGIPLIGAKLARGDWSIIERIILEEMKGLNATIVHFNQEPIQLTA